MTRARFTLGVAILAAGITGGCAHFYTIPGEPLTTEEVCARAEAAHVRSAPSGVGYSTGYLRERPAEAIYLSGDGGSFLLISPANGFYHAVRYDYMEASPRRSSGPGYWTLRCREARERDERAALDRDTAILTP